jgi:flavodoxin I
MKALVIYDSAWGNTEKVARAVAQGLADDAGAEAGAAAVPVEVLHANDVTLERLTEAAPDLLVVGGPTQRFRPTKPVVDMVRRICGAGLKGRKAAVFDTRIDADDVGSKALRFIVSKGGYAAPRIASALEKGGGTLVAPPEGFFVEDTEGPLRDGELERAAAWGRGLREAARG